MEVPEPTVAPVAQQGAYRAYEHAGLLSRGIRFSPSAGQLVGTLERATTEDDRQPLMTSFHYGYERCDPRMCSGKTIAQGVLCVESLTTMGHRGKQRSRTPTPERAHHLSKMARYLSCAFHGCGRGIRTLVSRSRICCPAAGRSRNDARLPDCAMSRRIGQSAPQGAVSVARVELAIPPSRTECSTRLSHTLIGPWVSRSAWPHGGHDTQGVRSGAEIHRRHGSLRAACGSCDPGGRSPRNRIGPTALSEL